ncbi:MAG: transglycosylase SLT domain-containing protein [Prevotella sp.]|nr:transglycosylase SLT domain-containing protein [Prevotella sp.]
MKIRKTILALWALLPMALPAQIVDTDDLDDYDDEDEAEVEVLYNEEEGDYSPGFDFPEALTDANLDSLMNQYMSKTYLQDDAGCQQLSENPQFDREVYIDRLRRMPTVMEMAYNDVVRSCIDRYMGRLRRQVSYMLGAANFYMPIFEQALDTYQLPLELKYLPIIESALNPTAVSRAGATGLWQFMLATGKAYGLEVTSLSDDRRDPVKSSYAAARYLRDLYNIFGDWNLVIAAYNCGPENINKAIRRSGGKRDYWAIYPYLPKETRGYVPAFIAANYAMTYYCEHGICPMASKLPVKTDTVMVDRNITFQQVAQVCNLDVDMLRSLNPVYRRDLVPGLSAPSALRLPTTEVGRFIDMQDSIYHGAAVMQTKRDEVAIDETPVVQSTPKRTTTKRSQRNQRSVTVKVKRGDTLSSIARRNGTTVARIKQLNGLRGNNIRAGQNIRVK